MPPFATLHFTCWPTITYIIDSLQSSKNPKTRFEIWCLHQASKRLGARSQHILILFNLVQFPVFMWLVLWPNNVLVDWFLPVFLIQIFIPIFKRVWNFGLVLFTQVADPWTSKCFAIPSLVQGSLLNETIYSEDSYITLHYIT